MKRLGSLLLVLALSALPLAAETDYVASGYQYLDQGDLERAERMFKGAIKINVENDAAWAGLRKVHEAQAKSDQPAPAAAPARGRKAKAGASKKRGSAAAAPAPVAAVDDDSPRLSLSERPPRTSAPRYLDPDAPAAEAPAAERAPLEPPAEDPPPVEPADPDASPRVEEINKKLLTKYLAGERSAPPEEDSSGDAKPAKGKASKKPKKPPVEEDSSASSGSADEGEPARPAAAVEEKLDENIDKDLLRNAKRAGEDFNKLREWASNPWKRESNGATQFIPTYYGPQLYKLLVTKLGAQKNWSVADTQKKYRRLMNDNKGLLEFYVKIINTTRKPKAAVPVGDICERTLLEDDSGNSYKPTKFKAPAVTKLLDEDSYTVWFPKYDTDGNSIVDKAKEKLFLVINDQEQEPATIRIAFTKKQFDSKAGSKKDNRAWYQKLF